MTAGTENGNGRVLVLQHAAPEHPGLITEALRSAGVVTDVRQTHHGQPAPPSLAGYSGLVIMGGPQSVYEEDRYLYLRDEKRLAREALDVGAPVLGVCLGSQIIAEALGSSVRPGPAPEIGWRPVRRAPNAAADLVLSRLPETFTPLHWHGDVYDLPPGAIPAGASDMTPVQGFSYGDAVHALLFHLEMTQEQVQAMAEEFPDDVHRGGLEPAALLAETPRRIAALEGIARDVFGAWAGLLSRSRA